MCRYLSILSVVLLLLPPALADAECSLALVQTQARIHRTGTNATKKPHNNCSALPNQVKGLVPVQGAWLGTGWGEETLREENFKQYNLQVPEAHVFRVYTHLADVEKWMTGHYKHSFRRHAEAGKILWFDVMPTEWNKCAQGGCDEEFRTLAKVVKAVTPGSAFVSIGHEIDHRWPDVNGDNADYIWMVRRAHTVLKESGCTNAVWKYVLSNQILDDDPEAWDNAMARWPGDEYVDWLGLNVYLKKAAANDDGVTANYVYGETYYNYKRGHSISHILDKLHKKFEKISKPGLDFMSKHWALSTVGVHSEKFDETFEDILGNKNLGVPTDFRVEWIEELNRVMNSGDYSNFKMVGYFDYGDCRIDKSVIKAFHEYSSSDVFTLNHACWA